MRKYDPKSTSESVDALMQGVLLLENMEECYRFFEDLCTQSELKAMAERFQVAKLLRERKTYIDIEDRTGASTATISRVNRFLNYGNDGYKMILERLRDFKNRSNP